MEGCVKLCKKRPGLASGVVPYQNPLVTYGSFTSVSSLTLALVFLILAILIGVSWDLIVL